MSAILICIGLLAIMGISMLVVCVLFSSVDSSAMTDYELYGPDERERKKKKMGMTIKEYEEHISKHINNRKK